MNNYEFQYNLNVDSAIIIANILEKENKKEENSENDEDE